MSCVNKDDYGDPDQDGPAEIIRKNKEDVSSMDTREKIERLTEEIDAYKTAQHNAGEALASAEMELDEVLTEEFRNTEKE